MLKVNNKDARTTPLALLLTLKIFPPCSTVSIANLEQVNADWEDVFLQHS